jgi:hypothetical protein
MPLTFALLLATSLTFDGQYHLATKSPTREGVIVVTRRHGSYRAWGLTVERSAKPSSLETWTLDLAGKPAGRKLVANGATLTFTADGMKVTGAPDFNGTYTREPLDPPMLPKDAAGDRDRDSAASEPSSLTIETRPNGMMHVTGVALWGRNDDDDSPRVTDIDFEAPLADNTITWKDGDYRLELHFIGDELWVAEHAGGGHNALNVQFAGKYE